ncbi:Uncharacterised protein [Legionella pneumophila]|nr:Uncharacterised protein [Legionella pneumophila]
MSRAENKIFLKQHMLEVSKLILNLYANFIKQGVF